VPLRAVSLPVQLDLHPPRSSGPTGQDRRQKAGSRCLTEYVTVIPNVSTKPETEGTPQLDREMEDENQAMIEALKRDGTFLILSEWRPKVDNSTKGRAVIEKEAVSGSKS
jgi:hypothetical protein